MHSVPVCGDANPCRLFLLFHVIFINIQISALYITIIFHFRNKIKNTRNRSIVHEGQCIPAGYCHVHMLLYVSGVNYNVDSNYTKYFAQLCGRIFTFLEYFHHKLANFVATPTDGSAKCLVHYKVHLVP